MRRTQTGYLPTLRSEPHLKRRKGWLSSFFFCIAVTFAALTACDNTPTAMPTIVVNITAVDNTTALAEAVREAVAGTEQANLDMTATVFAQGGVTLTPSNTPTSTLTPTPTITRYVTATPTPTATQTSTATFAPYLTNTPEPVGDTSNGWLRVINAWQYGKPANALGQFDVYINDQRVDRALGAGDQTTYFRVLAGVVRVSLSSVDSTYAPDEQKEAPVLSASIAVPMGGVVTALAVDVGQGLELIPVVEDSSPLPDGLARLTILQMNPFLIDANVLFPTEGRALAYDLKPRDIVGPFDLPIGSFRFSLYDAQHPDQILQSIQDPLALSNQLNYLMLLIPSPSDVTTTEAVMFSGVTRLLESDFSARFVNTTSFPIALTIDGKLQFSSLAVGAISEPVPISRLGTTLTVQNEQGSTYFSNRLGPWSTPDEASTAKLFFLVDNSTPTERKFDVSTLFQDPPTSAINAQIRLIHGLPRTRSLVLQVRPYRIRIVPDSQGRQSAQVIGEDELPWTTVGEVAQIGSASSYVGRAPEVYQVRAVVSGSTDPIAAPLTLQLLPGGIYDFAVLPSAVVGAATIEVIQPIVQIGGIGSSEDSATAVFEGVNATLTALAPQTTATPTPASSPTATRTPVPTNTPRPTNTPAVLPPFVQLQPAPPNTTTGSLILSGQNFAPGKAFRVTVDNDSNPLLSGSVGSDGSLAEVTIALPTAVAPGTHTLKICVDCSSRGFNQVEYAVFIVADPNMTATPTATP